MHSALWLALSACEAVETFSRKRRSHPDASAERMSDLVSSFTAKYAKRRENSQNIAAL